MSSDFFDFFLSPSYSPVVIVLRFPFCMQYHVLASAQSCGQLFAIIIVVVVIVVKVCFFLPVHC